MFSFIAACFAIEATPGPNMTYLALVSSLNGRKAGFSMVAGIALGLLLIGMAASLGAAALIAQSPVLYEILRWSGVVYLLLLAGLTWRGERAHIPNGDSLDLRHFQRGLITNILNPKAAAFYITVMPSFINPAHPALPQSLLMTGIYVTIATIVHIGIVLLADQARPFLEDRKKENTIRRVFAVLLALIALWFAWSSRS